jgi:hypothetical protein
MTADIPLPDPRLTGKIQIKQMQGPQSQQRIFSAAELQTMTFQPLKFPPWSLAPNAHQRCSAMNFRISSHWRLISIVFLLTPGSCISASV